MEIRVLLGFLLINIEGVLGLFLCKNFSMYMMIVYEGNEISFGRV